MTPSIHFQSLVLFLILLDPNCATLSFPSKATDEPLNRSWRNSTLSVPLLLTQENQANPSVERAESIFRKSLEAYGGKAKILSVKDATYEYVVEAMEDSKAKPLTMRTYFKNESYFRSEANGDNLDAITILNGETGWVKVGDTTLTLARKEIDPLRIGMIAQLRPDLLLLSFPKRRYTGQVQENNRTLDQVEISGFIGGEYFRGRLSFDVNTALVYKYEFEIERDSSKGKGIVKGEEKYLQYRETNGFKFPVEIISKQGRKVSKLTVGQVDFSSVLNESLFQDPGPPPAKTK
jgi:hypothetical protein